MTDKYGFEEHMTSKIKFGIDFMKHNQEDWEPPRLEVLVGDYKGMVLTITKSLIIEDSSIQQVRIDYDFTINKVWESYKEEDFKLSDDGKKYIDEMVTEYVLLAQEIKKCQTDQNI